METSLLIMSSQLPQTIASIYKTNCETNFDQTLMESFYLDLEPASFSATAAATPLRTSAKTSSSSFATPALVTTETSRRHSHRLPSLVVGLVRLHCQSILLRVGVHRLLLPLMIVWRLGSSAVSALSRHLSPHTSLLLPLGLGLMLLLPHPPSLGAVEFTTSLRSQGNSFMYRLADNNRYR